MNHTSDREQLPITRELFLEWRSPRLGTANPSVLTNPVWGWLVRTRMSAYEANRLLGGPSALEAGPGWCFSRFGQTTTALADGREILIAGEHEDYYDPDFFIYNDVVLKTPDGRVEIYGYPTELFPPTDFHTATLLPKNILLIGSLSYQDVRVNKTETQVLQLGIEDFSIQKIDAAGTSPGWIHRHTAVLSDDGQSISVSGGMVESGSAEKSSKENIDEWVLDLRNWTWTRSTQRDWQQWTYRRADRKHSQLWHIRQAIWLRRMGWKDELAREMQQLEANIGGAPDLDLVPHLYRPDESFTELPQDKDHYNVFRVLVDGVVVRFTEQGHLIRALVEGRLEPELLNALQESVRTKLAALEGATWDIEML